MSLMVSVEKSLMIVSTSVVKNGSSMHTVDLRKIRGLGLQVYSVFCEKCGECEAW